MQNTDINTELHFETVKAVYHAVVKTLLDLLLSVTL